MTSPTTRYSRATLILALMLPIIAITLMGYYAMPPKPASAEQTIDTYRFGQLPVYYSGRKMPFDTLARIALKEISARETFRETDQQGQLSSKKLPATQWLLDVISPTNKALDHQVFRITHHQVLEMLKLKPRPGFFRYAISEFREQLGQVDRHLREAQQKSADQQDAFDHEVLALAQKLDIYQRLKQSFQIPTNDAEQVKAIMRHFRPLETSGKVLPLSVVTFEPEAKWMPLTRAGLMRIVLSKQMPSYEHLAMMLVAYSQNNAKQFNERLALYEDFLTTAPNEATAPAGLNAFENWYNYFAPFYRCGVLYAVAFLLCCLALLWPRSPLRQGIFTLLLVGLAVHTAAMIIRMNISGYPPVTNLYSVAVFMGWGCLVLGVILELIYRMGIGNVVAAIAGLTTILIEQAEGAKGDTMAPVMAVLNTQFWLSTHVTTMVLGYTATFVAGLIAILYLFGAIFTKRLNQTQAKEMGRMIYGILCFATLVSFIGTVLGGLWADDSWGRFWGWDAKENGALILVLWNALILHARWGGMVKIRGMALLAVFGNVVTSWSWYGVNQLGVGLHSYGFTDSVAYWLWLFFLSQMFIIALGLLIPTRCWRINRTTIKS